MDQQEPVHDASEGGGDEKKMTHSPIPATPASDPQPAAQPQAHPQDPPRSHPAPIQPRPPHPQHPHASLASYAQPYYAYRQTFSRELSFTPASRHLAAFDYSAVDPDLPHGSAVQTAEHIRNHGQDGPKGSEEEEEESSSEERQGDSQKGHGFEREQDEDLMSDLESGGGGAREAGESEASSRRTSNSSAAAPSRSHPSIQQQAFIARDQALQYVPNYYSSSQLSYPWSNPGVATYNSNPSPFQFSHSSFSNSSASMSNYQAANQGGFRMSYPSPYSHPYAAARTPNIPALIPRRPPLPTLPHSPPVSNANPDPSTVPPPPATRTPIRSRSNTASPAVAVEGQQNLQPIASASTRPRPPGQQVQTAFDDANQVPTQADAHAPPTSDARKRLAKPANSYRIPGITGMAPFITKLRYMMLNPQEFGDVLGWSTDGQVVLVDFSLEDLTKDVLPRVFNHQNAGGFARQFTNYGFVQLKGEELRRALEYSPPPTGEEADEGEEAIDLDAHDLPPTTSTSPDEQLAPSNGSLDQEPEDEGGEGEEETQVPRDPQHWRAFKHVHSQAQLAQARTKEAADRRKKKKKNNQSTKQEHEDEGEEMEEESEEEEEEEEDGNWFCRTSMQDLKLLKRLKPGSGKSLTTSAAANGGGQKKKNGTSQDGGENDDEDGEEGGGPKKKAKKAVGSNSIAAIAGASGSGGLGGGNGGAARYIGGVDVSKLLR